MKKSIWTILKELLFGGAGYNVTVYKLDDAGSYFYFNKKHYCEKCGALLETQSESTIEENYDSGATLLDGGGMNGTAKVIRHYFYCSQCDKRFTAKELKEAEKGKGKRSCLSTSKT